MIELTLTDLAIMFASGLVVLGILVSVEIARRFNLIRGEPARKAIHLLIGVFMASWPMFMTREQMLVLCLLFFVGMLVFSGLLHYFRAIEEVNRWTLGHLLYPIGVILVLLITSDQYIYSFSVLILALADAFAAIVGTAYGVKRYHILGGNKSYIGSLTFFLVSCTLIGTYAVLRYDPTLFALALTLAGSAFLMAIEGLFAGGFDNLAVPAMAALMLQSLS